MNKKTGIRLIASFKLAKGLLMIIVSFGIFRLIHADLEGVANRFLEITRIDPENHYIRLGLERFVDLSPGTIKRYGIAAGIYSILFLTEGFGLWFEKKWAEYLVILTSTVSLPIEIHEIMRHPTPLKYTIFGLNVLIIFFLCFVVLSKNAKHKSKKVKVSTQK